jgi:hypothetical protein
MSADVGGLADVFAGAPGHTTVAAVPEQTGQGENGVQAAKPDARYACPS